MTSFMPEEGPDVSLDDLYNAWKNVAYLEQQAFNLEHRLDAARAAYRYEALTNEAYWINNKPPTVVYLEKVIPFTGNTSSEGEHLTNLFGEYLESKKELTTAKGYLDVLHEKIRIWQTSSANSRKVLSVE